MLTFTVNEKMKKLQFEINILTFKGTLMVLSQQRQQHQKKLLFQLTVVLLSIADILLNFHTKRCCAHVTRLSLSYQTHICVLQSYTRLIERRYIRLFQQLFSVPNLLLVQIPDYRFPLYSPSIVVAECRIPTFGMNPFFLFVG